MTRSNWRRAFLAVVLAGAAAAAPAAAEEGCAAAQCHESLLKKAAVHPVAETCDSCHESTGGTHPEKGAKTFKLTQEPPALCQSCHETFGKKANQHPPVEQGMCTTCHNPHASDQPKLLEQSQPDLCQSCHPNHADFKFPHGPVATGECSACHQPHESDNKTLLVRTGEQLCFGCHVDLPETLKKKHVHPALKNGCPSCHNPHGADHPKLLAQEGQDLCFMCHGKIKEKIEQASVMHAALMTEKACASCHSPHASDYDKLLQKEVKDVCVACHDKIIPKNAKFLHGPNNDGRCTRCHEPHGGQYEKLLAKPFPPDVYVPYSDTEFALCFECHNRDLLQYPETSFATNFRDGERNLHYVHVHNPQKGRSCRLCHSFHGSPHPKLIADTAQFGKWSMPLKFVKTDTGGGCSPGCHRPLYYDRNEPGRKPEAGGRPTPRGR